jgi:soluble P-type ATPase
MIVVDIPGWGRAEMEHLVLDLNGTLAVDGVIPGGVTARIQELAASLQVHVLTADTFGSAAGYAGEGLQVRVLEPGDQVEAKARFVRALGATRTAAIGNGMNDEGMLREAALGIVVLGREGAAARAILAADVVVPSVEDGLDLLRFPRRLVASLRTE